MRDSLAWPDLSFVATLDYIRVSIVYNYLPPKPSSPLLLSSQHCCSFHCFQASSKSVVLIPPSKDNNVTIQ